MYLGIDLGTSGVKLLLLDAAHTVIATADAAVPQYRPQPTWSEQHPADWLAAVEAAVAQLRVQVPAAWAQVRGIGLSGHMHGAVVLGAQGQVLRPAILCLRIGGNDLLNLLGVRRSRHRTIYESALGPTMANLVTIFRPNGFHLTSPVCEFLYDHEVLKRELEMDVEYGIYGKTAIHPDQIALIEQAYAPSEQDARMADAILQPDAPAVFNMYGTMCEVATHTEWAKGVVARGRRYGRQGTNLLKVA